MRLPSFAVLAATFACGACDPISSPPKPSSVLPDAFAYGNDAGGRDPACAAFLAPVTGEHYATDFYARVLIDPALASYPLTAAIVDDASTTYEPLAPVAIAPDPDPPDEGLDIATFHFALDAGHRNTLYVSAYECDVMTTFFTN
jgi:hypothetical protein